MATLLPSRYLSLLSLLILLFKTISGFPNSTFSFKNFGEDSNFESTIALYGDAKVVGRGSSVQITGFSSSNPFSFSISPENGNGLVFVMVPGRFPVDVFDGDSFWLLSGNKNRTLGVEFVTLVDDKYEDLKGNHLLSVKVVNVYSINFVLNSGKKLQTWIDYKAGSKLLEVRLSQLGEMRPVDPLLSCPIELSQMWNENEVFIGLSSLNGRCNVYSWSFKLRRVPQLLHSEPLDPGDLFKNTEYLSIPKKCDCFLRILTALIFGIGCGALGTFLVLFAWTIFGKRPSVVPEEYPHPLPLGFFFMESSK